MPDKIVHVPQRLTRAASLIAKADGDGKTVTLSISSDEPYKRYDWWDDEEYWEVLDHGPNGIDEERLRAGLPILFNHSRDQHLGRGVSYENDGHKLTVTAKFSESAFAQEKFADIKSGVLLDSSVGYELVGDGVCIGALDELPIYKFRFKVYEGSLVTIPADCSVGVGRQRDNKPTEAPREIAIRSNEVIDTNANSEHTKTLPKPPMKLTPAAQRHFHAPDNGDNPAGGASPTAIDLGKERADAIKEHKAKCKKIDEFVAAVKNPAWQKKAAEIAIKHKDGDADFNEFRSEALNHFTTETVIDEPQRSDSRIQVIGERGNGSNGHRALSIGAEFVRSKDFQASGGRIQKGGTIAVEYPGFSMLGVRGKAALAHRAGFTSSDLASVNVQIMPGVIGLGVQRLTIADVISPGTTGAAAIIYPRENSFGTVNGVAVPANTFPRAQTVGERGLKPNWDPDLTTESATVKTIAITTKLPTQFLADFPATESYINERMPYMVDLEFEFQVLYGDGLGNNLKGIFTNAGIQTRAIDATSDTTIAASLKKGLTDIQVNAQFEPDFYGFHPYDWETASLLKDTAGRFLAGGPFYIPYTGGVYMELHTFWGKPVVVSTSITYGKPIAGAGKLGAQYFIREGMRIEMTNANEDDFRRNLICLRAEERATLATYRPVAFLEFTAFPARA